MAPAISANSTPKCSICQLDGKRLYCGSCVEFLVLKRRVAYVRIQLELTQIRAEIQAALGNEPAVRKPLPNSNSPEHDSDAANSPAVVLSDPKLGLWTEKIATLKFRTQRVRDNIRELKAAAALARSTAADVRARTQINIDQVSQEFSVARAEGARAKLEAEQEVGALDVRCRAIWEETTLEQRKTLGQLLTIFVLRKKKRSSSSAARADMGSNNTIYEVVLGQDIIPSLLRLERLGTSVLISGLERAAWFIALVGIYTGIALPFPIKLPGRRQSHILVGGQVLRLEQSLQTLAKADRKQLASFCLVAAKLALAAAHVAARLGLPGIDSQAAPQLGVLVAQVALRLGACVTAGDPLPLTTSIGLPIDAESLSLQICTRIEESSVKLGRRGYID